MAEIHAVLAAIRLVDAIDALPFRKHVATLCSVVSGAGTLFATNRLYEAAANGSTENSLTTAAIGMAVSTLTFVGSTAWLLYEQNRHLAYMRSRRQVRRLQRDVPYAILAGGSTRAEAILQEAVDRLGEVIPEQGVATTCKTDQVATKSGNCQKIKEITRKKEFLIDSDSAILTLEMD